MTVAHCIDCKTLHQHAILITVIETGSGPGGMIYACPEHARTYARFSTAPDWLKAEIAKLDEPEEPDDVPPTAS